MLINMLVGSEANKW